MKEKKTKYWEVTIKCSVRTEDINDNHVTKTQVKNDLRMDFDQVAFIIEKIEVK